MQRVVFTYDAGIPLRPRTITYWLDALRTIPRASLDGMTAKLRAYQLTPDDEGDDYFENPYLLDATATFDMSATAEQLAGRAWNFVVDAYVDPDAPPVERWFAGRLVPLHAGTSQ